MANILQYIYEKFPNSENKMSKCFPLRLLTFLWTDGELIGRSNFKMFQDECNLFHKPYFWLCSSCVVHVYETKDQIGLNLFDL